MTSGSWPGPFAAACHLAVLCAFAVAQPLYDLLARNATFFVAHRAGPTDLALFALVLSLGPAALLALLVRLLGRIGRDARWPLLACVALLAGLALLPPLHRAAAGAPAGLVVAGAGGLGALAALAYARLATVRSVLSALTPAVVVFPLVFLLHSPISRLLRPETGTAGARGVREVPPIVFVVFDGLALTSLLDGAGAVDAVRYPAFARLAATSTWYRDTTTVAEVTQLAVPAILTGRYPRPSREVPTAVDHPESLFTLLAGVHDMHVHESLTQLCPGWLCGVADGEPVLTTLWSMLSDTVVLYAHLLLPPALRGGLPSIDEQWRDFGTRVERAGPVPFGHLTVAAERADRAAAFDRFLAGIAPRPRPTLHFIHTPLPHTPFAYLPSGRTYTAPQKLAGAADLWRDDAPAAETAEERYLLQVGFVDRLLGRLLDRLAETALLDAALLVVTADHGCAFLPGEPHRYVTLGNYHDVAAVPLFVKEPGQREGRVRTQPLQTIDVLPTVAELMHVEVPWRVDGRSALAPERPDRRMIVRQSGDMWPVPADAGALDRAVARRIARFGAGTAWDTLFARGLQAGIIGEPIEGLLAANEAPYTVRLWDGGSRDLRDDGPLPAYVEGALVSKEAAASPPLVAIVVNGALASTVRTARRAGGELGFQTLVPEAVLRPGINRYEVFVVDEGTPAHVRLVRVPASQ